MGELFPHSPILFIIKERRRVRAEPAPFGAILYKKCGVEGHNAPRGVQGQRPCCLHDVQHVEVEAGGDDVGEGDGDEEHRGEYGEVLAPCFAVAEEYGEADACVHQEPAECGSEAEPAHEIEVADDDGRGAIRDGADDDGKQGRDIAIGGEEFHQSVLSDKMYDDSEDQVDDEDVKERSRAVLEGMKKILTEFC